MGEQGSILPRIAPKEHPQASMSAVSKVSSWSPFAHEIRNDTYLDVLESPTKWDLSRFIGTQRDDQRVFQDRRIIPR